MKSETIDSPHSSSEQQNTDLMGHVVLPAVVGAMVTPGFLKITGNDSPGLVEISGTVGAILGPFLWKGLGAGYVRVATNENIQRLIGSSISIG